jgi:hypothetical protein
MTAARFKSSDVTRAIKAARAAGLDTLDLVIGHEGTPIVRVLPKPANDAPKETGLSQADLLVLRWSDISSNVIHANRLKNGNAAAIPISPRLAAMLAEAPRTAHVILTGAREAPMNPKGNGLPSDFALASAKAKIEPDVPRPARHLHHRSPVIGRDDRRKSAVQRSQSGRGGGCPGRLRLPQGGRDAERDQASDALLRTEAGTTCANCQANQGPEWQGQFVLIPWIAIGGLTRNRTGCKDLQSSLWPTAWARLALLRKRDSSRSQMRRVGGDRS